LTAQRTPSGRADDIAVCERRGWKLSWVRNIADDSEAAPNTVNFAAQTWCSGFGGIGRAHGLDRSRRPRLWGIALHCTSEARRKFSVTNWAQVEFICTAQWGIPVGSRIYSQSKSTAFPGFGFIACILYWLFPYGWRGGWVLDTCVVDLQAANRHREPDLR